MNSQKIFEMFNHFLKTGDETELLPMADNVEVFGSATFSDGRTHIGKTAPERFRETIALVKASKTIISMKVKHVILSDHHSIFFLDISKGQTATGSVLDVVFKDGKLKCFHEAAAKV